MNLQQLRAVVAQVAFPGYEFGVSEVGGRYYLQGTFMAPCVEGGHKVRQFTRKWYLSNEATPSEIVQTVLKCVLTAAEHEVRESFTYRGRPIFGPHFDVECLVRLFDQQDPLARRAPSVATPR